MILATIAYQVERKFCTLVGGVQVLIMAFAYGRAITYNYLQNHFPPLKAD